MKITGISFVGRRLTRQGSGLNKICEAYENAANYEIGMEPEFCSDRVMFTKDCANYCRKILKYNRCIKRQIV